MELKIKSPNKVILSFFVANTLKIFAWVVGAFILSIILAIPLNKDPNIGIYGLLIWILLPLGYLVYLFLDAKTFSKKTIMKLGENSVEFASGNLISNINQHIPFGQIKSSQVNQNFSMKLFDIASLTVIDESGLATSLWGFSKKDADEFARALSEKSQERIQIAKNQSS